MSRARRGAALTVGEAAIAKAQKAVPRGAAAGDRCMKPLLDLLDSEQ